jgi:hypothetical protein
VDEAIEFCEYASSKSRMGLVNESASIYEIPLTTERAVLAYINIVKEAISKNTLRAHDGIIKVVEGVGKSVQFVGIHPVVFRHIDRSLFDFLNYTLTLTLHENPYEYDETILSILRRYMQGHPCESIRYVETRVNQGCVGCTSSTKKTSLLM